MALGEQLQPFFGDFGFDVFDIDDALEVRRKYPVVAVEVFFVLHQAGAREVIKVLNAAKNHVFLEGFQQNQKLLDGDWHIAFFQFQEKFYKHLFLNNFFRNIHLQFVTALCVGAALDCLCAVILQQVTAPIQTAASV